MYGSRLGKAAPRSPPPAPAITDNKEIQQRDKETRDPVTSPPLPVPDRIARGQPSPKGWPQLFWDRINALRVKFDGRLQVMEVTARHRREPPAPGMPRAPRCIRDHGRGDAC